MENTGKLCDQYIIVYNGYENHVITTGSLKLILQVKYCTNCFHILLRTLRNLGYNSRLIVDYVN